MGELLERVKLSLLVNGNGEAENFKNNSLYFYNKYLSSDDEVKSIDIKDINPGYFYFFHYKDDSNWMKWAPVFVADWKKMSNKIILLCVNFNLVPLEIRTLLFDKYMDDRNFDKNTPLKSSFNGMYDELRSVGFEYSLMEFNAIQLVSVHRINMESVPRFLYSQHPKNKYDPNKLIQIWTKKLETRDLRHKEITSSTLADFYNVNKDMSEKFDVLKGHIDRIQKSIQKYGK
jgi:hypothetical protein